MTEAPKSTPGLAPYACHEEASRGRLHDEAESATRRCFQRDRDRIIHSPAFRRLEYKTQVFVNHEGDNYRTRLTHTLEVSQITRSLCRSLELNEDLGEALALAHDLGHPPFGHTGEEALQEMMEPFGGFDHNAQSLSIITKLEERYANFDGLNLTWETLEGIVKHNGPLVGGEKDKPLPRVIAGYAQEQDLELDTFASAEAQVAALSDDIAYNNHDIDDGLRAGLFSVADLNRAPLAGPVFAAAARDDLRGDQSRLIHEGVRRMIGAMVEDVIAETQGRLAEANPASADDLRQLARPVAAFSAVMADDEKALKAFLYQYMYRHPHVTDRREVAQEIVRDLFRHFHDDPSRLPGDWRARAAASGSMRAARVVADYIAGMTDRYAVNLYKKVK